MIHSGDVLTVLGFRRQLHNQLSSLVWIHLYRCGGGLGSYFGCWGISFEKWWGVFWFWKFRLGLAIIIGWLMVHSAVSGRIVLHTILGLILISLRRVWTLRLKDLMAFSLFLKRFFTSYFHDAVIGRVLVTWNEFNIVLEWKFISPQGK